MREIWKPIRRIEQNYLSGINNITDMIYRAMKSKEDSQSIIEAIRDIATTSDFDEYCMKIASNMVTALYEHSASTWRRAAAKGTKGRYIYEAIRKELTGPQGEEFNRLISKNAGIIKTLPYDIAEKVTKYVSEESLKGKRASEIAKEIKDMFPDSSRAKANLIARTETSKTSSAITEGRSKRLGLNWYTWRTSKDARVRDSHAHMEGVIINYNEPPSPETLIGKKTHGYYHAGNIFNCRCYQEPVIDINNIQFPAKVYYGGRITNMNRVEFEKLL